MEGKSGANSKELVEIVKNIQDRYEQIHQKSLTLLAASHKQIQHDKQHLNLHSATVAKNQRCCAEGHNHVSDFCKPTTQDKKMLPRGSSENPSLADPFAHLFRLLGKKDQFPPFSPSTNSASPPTEKPTIPSKTSRKCRAKGLINGKSQHTCTTFWSGQRAATKTMQCKACCGKFAPTPSVSHQRYSSSIIMGAGNSSGGNAVNRSHQPKQPPRNYNNLHHHPAVSNVPTKSFNSNSSEKLHQVNSHCQKKNSNHDNTFVGFGTPKIVIQKDMATNTTSLVHSDDTFSHAEPLQSATDPTRAYLAKGYCFSTQSADSVSFDTESSADYVCSGSFYDDEREDFLSQEDTQEVDWLATREEDVFFTEEWNRSSNRPTFESGNCKVHSTTAANVPFVYAVSDNRFAQISLSHDNFLSATMHTNNNNNNNVDDTDVVFCANDAAMASSSVFQPSVHHYAPSTFSSIFEPQPIIFSS